MTERWWMWVGVGLAVAAMVVGASILLSARRPARHAKRRPARDAFRTEEPLPPRKRVTVVVNPLKVDDVAGLGRRLTAVCAEHDWEPPVVLTTTGHDIGFGQARQAVADGVDLVCVLGGDGTVRAVAQELVGTGMPLGLLAGGTGNLLARNLDVPTDDVERAFVVALTGRNRHVDAGWMTLDPDDATLDAHAGEGASAGFRRHAFFVMAGLGLDATIMGSTSEALKRRLGWTAYVPSGVRNMLTERFRVRMTIDGGPPFSRRARLVLVGNCGKITGGIELMPEAEPDDGTLDIVVLAPKGVTAWAGVAAKVLTKSDRTTATLSRYRCRTATVEVDDRHRVQVDGDIIGEARRIAVEIEPGALIVRTEARRLPTDPSPGTA
ncbi:MAG: diacylglycerol/lipid kinase family protein [Dermatophilaceae bacterium]